MDACWCMTGVGWSRTSYPCTCSSLPLLHVIAMYMDVHVVVVHDVRVDDVGKVRVSVLYDECRMGSHASCRHSLGCFAVLCCVLSLLSCVQRETVESARKEMLHVDASWDDVHMLFDIDGWCADGNVMRSGWLGVE